MNIISSSAILSKVAEEKPEIIPLLSRLGIKEGLGEERVKDICLKCKVNEEVLTLIVNLYLNSDYMPVLNLNEEETDSIRNYFDSTFNFYRNVQIPNIETHLRAFIARSEESSSIKMIEELFGNFKTIFLSGNSYDPEILSDIKNIMIRHLSGNYNANLYYAVIFALHSLIEDLRNHERLRVILLETLISDKSDVIGVRKNKKSPAGLSVRESEVLKLIVRGKLNKEIADELSISFNTVLTHRKNITSKLGIKSVPGLTLYAYISGLVSSEEIRG